jgi:hypothetical protein
MMMLQALLHLEQRITTAQSADVIVLKAVQLELSITLTFDLYQAKHYIGNYGHATSESFRKWARSLGISMPSEDDVDTPDESAIYSEKGHSLPCCLPPKTSQGFASRKNSGSENSKPRSGCLYARLSETKWEDSDFEKGKREWLDYLDQREHLEPTISATGWDDDSSGVVTAGNQANMATFSRLMMF